MPSPLTAWMLSILALLGSLAACRNDDGPTAVRPGPTGGPRQAPVTVTPADRLGTVPDDLGLPVGAVVPDVALSDAGGAEVMLSAARGDGPALVVFYRGGWCPYCNTQLKSLANAAPEFKAAGVQLVALSVDRPAEAARTRASWSIPFPVLADPELAAHRAFNVAFVVPADERARLEGFGIDLEAASGKTHHTIGVPSVFLVTRDGKVAWRHADPDYKTRPSIAHLLSVARQHGAPH